jgi:hypothetical protein
MIPVLHSNMVKLANLFALCRKIGYLSILKYKIMWKNFKYNNEYEININGEVRKKSNLKIYTPFKTTNGYMRIRINNKGYQVHRLIAEHFIENINNYNEINHIDGNKLNNSLSNLEWCTRSLNVKHAIINGLMNYNHLKGKKGHLHNKALLTKEQVIEIWNRLRTNESQNSIANSFNVNKNTISKIKLNKIYTNITENLKQ